MNNIATMYSAPIPGENKPERGYVNVTPRYMAPMVPSPKPPAPAASDRIDELLQAVLDLRAPVTSDQLFRLQGMAWAIKQERG